MPSRSSLPGLLTVANAHGAVTACLADAGHPGAHFTLAEGSGTVTVITGHLPEEARKQIEERLQAVVSPGVTVSVEVRTFFESASDPK